MSTQKDTGTLDKLYLELSEITSARNRREICATFKAAEVQNMLVSVQNRLEQAIKYANDADRANSLRAIWRTVMEATARLETVQSTLKYLGDRQ
jgi:GTP1/Obg family GTP-binding protein